MGWFGGRSDSVETVEGAQEVVSRVSSDLAKKKDTVKSLQKTVKALRAQRRESLVHEIVALKSYRDQLRATLASIDAEIAEARVRTSARRPIFVFPALTCKVPLSSFLLPQRRTEAPPGHLPGPDASQIFSNFSGGASIKKKRREASPRGL